MKSLASSLRFCSHCRLQLGKMNINMEQFLFSLGIKYTYVFKLLVKANDLTVSIINYY